MLFFKLINKKFPANLITKIDLKFLCRSKTNLKFTQLQGFASFSVRMPPKKITASVASKRKGEKLSESPQVKDPFSAAAAAKKSKINEKSTTKETEHEKEVNNGIVSKETNNKEIPQIKSRSPSPIAESAKKTKATTNGEKKAKAKSKKDDIEEQDENDTPSESAKSEATSTTKFSKEEFQKASNGKEWNLKIVSWNVNGIRAWVEKSGIEYLKAEDPDIFCLQETKCDKSKIPPKAELSPYHCYWASGDTQGYSGVGLLTKVKPIKVTFGIDEKKFDNEGRVITAEYDKFYLINSYIPNSGRGLDRLGFRVEWEKAFRNHLSKLEAIKPIIWTGDLNVAHNPIDLKNPDTNHKTAGFTKEERQCFTDLLTDGYFDSFRHLYPDQKGAYTFWSYLRNSRANNVGWRLDYFVLSEKLKEYLTDNVIRSKVTGSDHCPIVCFLKF